MLTTILIFIGVFFNVICIWSLFLLTKSNRKLIFKMCSKFLFGIPVGALLSLLMPINIKNIILFSLMGGVLGELLYIFFFAVQQLYKKENIISYYDDGSARKFFITGDKHRRFERVKNFCRDMKTRRKDVLIILGDAGLNYYNDKRDDALKKEISELSITLFCLHGNKENRPQNVGTYGIRSFCGGKVYYEPKYSNIYFAIDGEIYTFEGKKYMVVGGAHSVDKMRCLEEGTPFWPDEMPNDTVKAKVEQKLLNEKSKIYGIMTHTCPIDYLPTEMFMSTRRNANIKRKPKKAKSKKLFKPDIDRSTEIWLGEIEKNIDYKVWFCGHYHIDKQIDKIQMLCHDIRPLHMDFFGDEYGLSN